MFISHMQAESSGDVGTLYFLMGQLGVQCWRDMSTSELTESAMRQGVYDSDVFVLFLTNSVLSRVFCLKEISWALEFGKPIFIVVETENRFWQWDYDRWTRDECARNTSGGWVCAPLQISFSCCQEQYPHVVNLLKRHYFADTMMPFRRRDFEANALVRELLRRAGHCPDVAWGRYLPASQAERDASLSLPRKIWISASIPPAEQLVTQLGRSLTALSPRVHIAPSLEAASHVLFLLTEGVMSQSQHHQPSATEQELLRVFALQRPTVFAYSTVHGWDFDQFYKCHESEAKTTIASHEALAIRPLDRLAYEHHAMLLELLRRMR